MRRVGLLLVVFLCIPATLLAGEFWIDTTVNGQYRQNEALATEIPVNGYLGAGLALEKWDFSTQADMRLFRDFSRAFDDYDLYQAFVHMRPTESLEIDFGRQFLNQGFAVDLIDGVHFGIKAADFIAIDLYSGIPRTVETGDFNKNDGLLTGFSIGLRDIPRTNASLHVAWHKNDLGLNNLRENDAIRLGLALSHQFFSARGPLLYGLFEYNAAANLVETGSAGLDFYAGPIASVNLEFNYFNVDRLDSRPSILSLFTVGRLLSGRLASHWVLVPGLLEGIQSYAYQRVEIQDGVFRNGHLFDTNFLLSLDELGLYVRPAYYFFNSFGGKVHGARLYVHEQWTDEFYTDIDFDFSVYRKITQDNDNAFFVSAWAGYEIFKNLTAAAGFEYNRNNAFTHDIRGAFKIEYHYDHTI